MFPNCLTTFFTLIARVKLCSPIFLFGKVIIKVWFLELNGLPIAYVLVFKHNHVLFFEKTSYDQRFKPVSPGNFLFNELIESIF